MVLICIALRISGDEHLFMYLLAISMSSWENVCSIPLPLFKLGVFSFFSPCWVVWVHHILWILTPYQVDDLEIFLIFCTLPFILLIISFAGSFAAFLFLASVLVCICLLPFQACSVLHSGLWNHQLCSALALLLFLQFWYARERKKTTPLKIPILD